MSKESRLRIRELARGFGTQLYTDYGEEYIYYERIGWVIAWNLIKEEFGYE